MTGWEDSRDLSQPDKRKVVDSTTGTGAADVIPGDSDVTPEAFHAAMAALAVEVPYPNLVTRHAMADAILCNVLRKLGYGEGVEVFVCMEKWYEE